MKEHDLRVLIEDVKTGHLSRRKFVEMMLGAGLTAPMAGMMLMHSGVANAEPPFPYKPTKRGGGGTLKLLWWQGPTLLNPHFATGTKDQDGSRLFYEALATWDGDGNLVPVLAAEIPSAQNGGLAKDGKSVTWKIKKNVTWHDGKPLTADDLVFNWEYASDPATAAVTIGSYKDVKVVKVDSHTVRVEFTKPTPFWADAFVGNRGLIIPKHLFDAYRGGKSRDAPNNLTPVGTGPYKFVDFKPGDMVRGAIYTNYHEANKPHFDAVEMKGGGDAVSAARAVLQTGEFDLAWNMQVEDEILKRLEAAGKGRVDIAAGGSMEMIQMQWTDPWTEIEGERASIKSKHPTLTDPAVRTAMNMLVDRASMQEHIYGRTGIATRNFLANPARFRSPQQKWEYDIDKANKVLEDAGWKKGSDGIREKGGKKLKFVYQTSINAPRQKCQAVVKQACQKAGIDIELKSVVASVYFSSDVANPDTYTKFFADIQMYNTTMPQPDPEIFMNQYVSWEVSSKANKWQGRNIVRWVNDEYDKNYRAAEAELDPVKRAANFIRMNDLLVEHKVVIPLVNRPQVTAVSNKLKAYLSGWDNLTGHMKDWYREAEQTAMGKYLIRRLLIAIPSLLGISVILFTVLALAPGDPFEELATNPNVPPEVRANLRAKFGMDDPVPIRYARWVTSMAKGDMGFSFASRIDVDKLIVQRLPATLFVIGSSQILALLIAIPVGVFAATRPYSLFDQVANTLAFVGFSLPTFFTGLLFILFFSIYLDWLPFVYRADIAETGWRWYWVHFKQSIMPIAVLGLFQAASWTRYVRSAVLDVIRLDYVTTARSKGLTEKVVVIKHALRNALIPVVTLVALQMPAIFGGAIVTEQIFRVPGIGSLLISAILANDTPVIMAVTFVFACLVVLFNLIADLLYGWLDPRIAYR